MEPPTAIVALSSEFNWIKFLLACQRRRGGRLGQASLEGIRMREAIVRFECVERRTCIPLRVSQPNVFSVETAKALDATGADLKRSDRKSRGKNPHLTAASRAAGDDEAVYDDDGDDEGGGGEARVKQPGQPPSARRLPRQT